MLSILNETKLKISDSNVNTKIILVVVKCKVEKNMYIKTF